MEEQTKSQDTDDDPIRTKLIETAVQVVATKGYLGTKIMDVVKAAGLSSGAVYGRFDSKDDLLVEALLFSVRKRAAARRLEEQTVTRVLVETAHADGPLDVGEAMQLEAFIAARREASVAAAIDDARRKWFSTFVQPLIDQAIAEGMADADADFESIVYFVETLQLGLLVQRGAGQMPPNPDTWRQFIARVFESMGHAAPTDD
jgi:AcrR family transcriptional regulator